MTFLSPWALAGLVLVPAVLLWGLLAPRGRPHVVGSLMLWQRVLGRGAGRASARVRLRDPVLWADAALLALVILALARPAVPSAESLQPVATLVIDRSASMSMIDEAGPRHERARALAAEALARLGDAPVRVVSVPGPGGAVVAETLSARALAADASRFAPVLASADAAAVAAAQAAAQPDRPVVLVTDVASPAPLPANVHVLATGGGGQNAGLVRVAARIEGQRWWLLVRARAAAQARGAYALEVTSGGERLEHRDGFLAAEAGAEATAGADTVAEAVLPVAGPPPADVRVALVGPDDGFAADNACTLALEPARPVRVLVTGAPAADLCRALEARPDTQVLTEAGTGDEAGRSVSAQDVDLVVAVASPLPQGWRGPAAVVAPPSDVGPVRVTGQGAPAAWQVAAEHPLAGALYLPPPEVRQALGAALDDGARVLVGTRDAPLVVTWEADGVRRLAVLFALDAAATDWPRRAGFPVFWSHAVAWLVPAAGRPAALRTHRPFEEMPDGRGLVPPVLGFATVGGRTVGVSLVGTGEGFEQGPAHSAAPALAAALDRACEASRADGHAALWPVLAAAALVAAIVRAWVSR
jgi:hypothetical protein